MTLQRSALFPLSAFIYLLLALPLMAQSVDSFTLIDADSDADIQTLNNGDTINLATVPSRNLNVRANTTPATVGSVRFALDGNANYRIESTPPYALAGDTSGNYNPWTPSVGSHALGATPFPDAGAGGTPGTPLNISFTVIDDGGGPPPPCGTGDATVSGELKKWHRVSVTFDGPNVSEGGSPNPFLDYRLDVTFTSPTARTLTVPGFYATDGNAAESGASTGGKWRVHFAPDETGPWTYSTSFRRGTNIAVSSNPSDGVAECFNGASGGFAIATSDKVGRDHRGKGRLDYVGERYLQFAQTGEHFLKGGADSPENFLAFADFDQTTPTHAYAPHAGDWSAGDPVWKGALGKNIVGALNYLASEGMNSVYFLTMNVTGDGNDVWPWTANSQRTRFDASKLDQWEIVFSHMDRVGIQLHVITQETENDQLLDGGALGTERRLYYRELIARFGHHLALVWNLGEENTNTNAQRQEFASYIRGLDVYHHPIVVHTFPGSKDSVYVPLLGFGNFEGPSLQEGNMNSTHGDTIRWIDDSAAAGRPWFVCVDEIGPANDGVIPDAEDPAHDNVRKEALWGNLMAGGAGAEWYFGYQHPHTDLNCEDWRSRNIMWDQTRYALEFFQQHLPFPEMTHADNLTAATSDYVLAKTGEVYAIYLKNGGTTTLDLGASSGTFSVDWYNPRAGGALQQGSVTSITGPGMLSIGNPPGDSAQDWAVLVQAVAGCLTPADCDDGLFCNGAESCAAGTCVPGSDPCAGQSCDEGTDSCTPPPVCNNNGTCETGEDCNNCPADCASGTTASCGNGVCEAGNGEDCLSCAADCAGVQNGKPSGRYCCGDGDGQNPLSCGDNRCVAGGFSCTDVPAIASCCGDIVCEGAENPVSCSVDCGAPPACGDGACDPGETQCSCAADCGAPPPGEAPGSTCTDGEDNDCDGNVDCADSDCAADSACSMSFICGNGVCEGNGENCFSCAADCRCTGPNCAKSCCGDGLCVGENSNQCAVDCGP